MQPVALTIAGSDPSGGAGIQADLKTFHQFGVYGEAIITLVTVQNTVSLERVECMPAVLGLGALGNRSIVHAVAGAAADFRFPFVVDPVMVSKHGRLLVTKDALEAMRDELIRQASLVTPNLAEASALTGREVQDLDGMHQAAREIHGMGAKAVLVKGGHLAGDAVDVLYMSGGLTRQFRAPRIETKNTHGTGCTYSAAITAELARGTLLEHAVERAKSFVTEAIRSAPGLGKGSGPLNHHASLGLARGGGAE